MNLLILVYSHSIVIITFLKITKNKNKMYFVFQFLSTLYNIWRRVSSYRGDIESLHKAVNKADIDEVIDILKLYNNEEVHSSIFLRSSDFILLEKHIFVFYRKCNMNVFGLMYFEILLKWKPNDWQTM